MKKIFIILLFFFLVEFTSAEVYKFFDFAPDLSVKFAIIPENEFIQKFSPFNDFLSLIRIWVENPNSVTSFNFQLLDHQNNILVDKEINVPRIDVSWAGFPFDIPLGNNLRINSGQEYKMKITTQNRDSLKIFAFSLLELIQNIETSLNLPETIRPLILNNQEQNYSFKIALYEGEENTPPLISNLTYQLINDASAEISFNANEPIRYSLLFYDNISNTTQTQSVDYFESCPLNIRKCSLLINILPDRIYYLTLTAYDYWQNSSTAELIFNTFRNNNSSTNYSTSSISYGNTSSNEVLNNSSNKRDNLSFSPEDKQKSEILSSKNKKINSQQKKSNFRNISENLSKEQKSEINQQIETSSQDFSKENNLKIQQKNEDKQSLILNYKNNKEETKDIQKISYFKLFLLIISVLIILFVIIGSIFIKRKK